MTLCFFKRWKLSLRWPWWQIKTWRWSVLNPILSIRWISNSAVCGTSRVSSDPQLVPSKNSNCYWTVFFLWSTNADSFRRKNPSTTLQPTRQLPPWTRTNSLKPVSSSIWEPSCDKKKHFYNVYLSEPKYFKSDTFFYWPLTVTAPKTSIFKEYNKTSTLLVKPSLSILLSTKLN